MGPRTYGAVEKVVQVLHMLENWRILHDSDSGQFVAFHYMKDPPDYIRHHLFLVLNV